MEEQEQQYIKGFNGGYLLSKHEPDLTAKISQNLQPNTGYLEGFLSGKEEYQLENSRIQLNELEELRSRTKERENDLERGE
jgi:hypothetical protein